MSTPTLCRELLGRGFSDVTVPDVSQEALCTAKAQMADLGAVSWVHADLLGWTPTRRWDVWHDRAVFHFLTEPHEREAYRRLLDVAVVPGGVVLVTTFAPEGPGTCSGLQVRRYDPADLLVELGAGFTEVARGRFVHTTPSGVPQPMTWIAARVPKVDPEQPVA